MRVVNEWKKLTDASTTSFMRNYFIDFSLYSADNFRLKLKLLPIACTHTNGSNRAFDRQDVEWRKMHKETEMWNRMWKQRKNQKTKLELKVQTTKFVLLLAHFFPVFRLSQNRTNSLHFFIAIGCFGRPVGRCLTLFLPLHFVYKTPSAFFSDRHLCVDVGADVVYALYAYVCVSLCVSTCLYALLPWVCVCVRTCVCVYVASSCGAWPLKYVFVLSFLHIRQLTFQQRASVNELRL